MRWHNIFAENQAGKDTGILGLTLWEFAALVVNYGVSNTIVLEIP